jgi:hypothetical protein
VDGEVNRAREYNPSWRGKVWIGGARFGWPGRITVRGVVLLRRRPVPIPTDARVGDEASSNVCKPVCLSYVQRSTAFQICT